MIIKDGVYFALCHPIQNPFFFSFLNFSWTLINVYFRLQVYSVISGLHNM